MESDGAKSDYADQHGTQGNHRVLADFWPREGVRRHHHVDQARERVVELGKVGGARILWLAELVDCGWHSPVAGGGLCGAGLDDSGSRGHTDEECEQQRHHTEREGRY
eukprot:scaffold204999_cov30-Tisochrysis_lutea.AAC.2